MPSRLRKTFPDIGSVDATKYRGLGCPGFWEENSVIQFFRITAADGKSYDTQHYNLPAIIAVGYKVNSERAVQFRKWATSIIESFTIKGFAMDDERLKSDGSVLGKQYFEEQLQRIREIRLSERTARLRLSRCG